MQSLPQIMPSTDYKEFSRRKSNAPLSSLTKIKELAEVGETIKVDKRDIRLLKILHHYIAQCDLSTVDFWDVVKGR